MDNFATEESPSLFSDPLGWMMGKLERLVADWREREDEITDHRVQQNIVKEMAKNPDMAEAWQNAYEQVKGVPLNLLGVGEISQNSDISVAALPNIKSEDISLTTPPR